jgi:hypothetical protein
LLYRLHHFIDIDVIIKALMGAVRDISQDKIRGFDNHYSGEKWRTRVVDFRAFCIEWAVKESFKSLSFSELQT